MKKILIVQTRVGIGDMCVFLPCIHKIAKFLENSEIHLLTKKRTCSKAFLNEDKYIKEVLYLSEETGIRLNINILNLLKENKYDECYILHYGVRYYLLSLLAGIKKIRFYGILKKKESIVQKSRSMVLQWTDKKKINFEPKIFLNKKYGKLNQITIGIGGSGSPKKWKIKNYIKLLNMILTNNKIYNIVIAGGKDELEDANKIFLSLRNKKTIKIFNLCDKTIDESIPILAKSKVYIGNDTGFMHLSGLLDTITIGIFGASPPDYSSYNEKIIPILPPGVDNVAYGDNMMDQITPDKVYQTIKKVSQIK